MTDAATLLLHGTAAVTTQVMDVLGSLADGDLHLELDVYGGEGATTTVAGRSIAHLAPTIRDHLARWGFPFFLLPQTTFLRDGFRAYRVVSRGAITLTDVAATYREAGLLDTWAVTTDARTAMFIEWQAAELAVVGGNPEFPAGYLDRTLWLARQAFDSAVPPSGAARS